MATYTHGFSIALVLFISCGAMLVASQAPAPAPVTAKDIEGDPTDPWYHRKLPPQPRPGYNAYLGNCLTIITKPCGKQMFGYIFNGAKIDNKCCCKLEKAGKLCNKAISWTLSHLDQFKPKASSILTKSDLAFDTCSRLNVGNFKESNVQVAQK